MYIHLSIYVFNVEENLYLDTQLKLSPAKKCICIYGVCLYWATDYSANLKCVYDLHQLLKCWICSRILCLVRGTHNPMIHVYGTCYSRNNVHAYGHKRAFSKTYRASAWPKHGNPLISMKYNMEELSSWLWNAHFRDMPIFIQRANWWYTFLDNNCYKHCKE